MAVLRRHLYVLVLMVSVIGVDTGKDVTETSNKHKQTRYLTHDRKSGQQILRNHVSKRKLHLKIPDTTGNVRKTSDQYKWPWKTYEEWKRNQERIENEIDRILAPGKNVHLSYNRTKIPNSKHRHKSNPRKRKERPDSKRRSKRKKKTKLEKHNERILKKTEHESDVSSGGAVLSVKYYSTDGVTDNAIKSETVVGSISHKALSIGEDEILASENLRRKMNSRWFSKHKRGDGCSINNGGCESLCVQTKSSHFCHCPGGFKLDTSRRKCIDLNECLPRNGHGPCQGDCLNEWGSFKCGCDSIPGTQLDPDGITCVPVDLCAGTDCSHICINTRSGAFCSCPEGLILDDDWKTCKEVSSDG